MTWHVAVALALACLTALACDSRGQAEREAAPPPRDTVRPPDSTAAVVGDTIMARDTMP